MFHLIQKVRAKDSPELLDLTTTIRNGENKSVEISTLAARNLQTLPNAEKVEFAGGVTTHPRDTQHRPTRNSN